MLRNSWILFLWIVSTTSISMCLGRNLVYIKRHKCKISEPNRKLTKPDLSALTASENVNKPQNHDKLLQHDIKTYNKDFLLKQSDIVRNNIALHKLKPEICWNIQDLNLRRRGKRCGVRLRMHLDIIRPDKSNYDNLIPVIIQAEPEDNIKAKYFNISLLNAQSIRNKDSIIHHQISQDNIDAIVFIETWLTESDGDKVWIGVTELQTTNYKLYSCPRKNKRGGGIALCTRPTYKVRLISEGEKSTFQYAKWCMETSHMCLTVLGIYRPPSGSAIKVLGKLTDWLPKNALLDTNPTIMGDFNLHVNNENDDDSMNFLEMMLALGLKQNVMFDTHKSGNTLDLIFTETESKITVKSVYKGEQLSDHSIVHMVISLQKDKYEKCVIQFRDLTNLNYEELADDIHTICTRRRKRYQYSFCMV